jgi:hypothetical protein
MNRIVQHLLGLLLIINLWLFQQKARAVAYVAIPHSEFWDTSFSSSSDPEMLMMQDVSIKKGASCYEKIYHLNQEESPPTILIDFTNVCWV